MVMSSKIDSIISGLVAISDWTAERSGPRSRRLGAPSSGNRLMDTSRAGAHALGPRSS